MTEFAAQSAQLVWFVTDTSGLVADSLMRSILSLDSDVMQTNRIPNPQMPFLSSAARVEGQYKFVLNVSPGRVDLFIQPGTDKADASPTLIDAKHALETVINALERQTAFEMQNVYRFAIVCAFMDEKDTGDAAVRAFFDKIGKPYMVGTTDHSFGINVRKKIDGMEHECNRLVRYSIELVQQIEMTAPASGGFGFGNGRVVNEAHFLKSIIDVNNVPENGVFFNAAELMDMTKTFCREIIFMYEIKEIGEMQ